MSRYFENLRTQEEGSDSDVEEVYPDGGMFSENLDQSGLHWKILTVGEKAQLQGFRAVEAEHLLQDYIPQCVKLEQFSFPLTAAHLVRLLLSFIFIHRPKLTFHRRLY